MLISFIGQCLQFFYNLTVSIGLPNYGLAIIIFTVVVKGVLFPLTYSQFKSLQKIQALQPKVLEIQKKHKNNPQKAQQAIMELYQENKANPLAGCLPLLIQLPILFALFAALRSFFDPVAHPPYVNLEHAVFFWIPNLGSPDAVILPLLAAATTFLQQWVTMAFAQPGGGNPSAEQTQKMMLYIMPVFMGFICRGFPAGLALYWVVYAVVSALEQFVIRRPLWGVKGEVSAK